MTSVQARLFGAFAALPISFLAIPYVFWRSRQEPWWNVVLRSLLIIFAAWLVVLFLPAASTDLAPPMWILCFGVIIWVSLGLEGRIMRAQPQRAPDEPWRR